MLGKRALTNFAAIIVIFGTSSSLVFAVDISYGLNQKECLTSALTKALAHTPYRNAEIDSKSFEKTTVFFRTNSLVDNYYLFKVKVKGKPKDVEQVFYAGVDGGTWGEGGKSAHSDKDEQSGCYIENVYLQKPGALKFSIFNSTVFNLKEYKKNNSNETGDAKSVAQTPAKQLPFVNSNYDETFKPAAKADDK
jgi:hypothetical protein